MDFCGCAASRVTSSTWLPSVVNEEAFTPGILPSALRASLRLFKIVPDDFVSQLRGAADG